MGQIDAEVDYWLVVEVLQRSQGLQDVELRRCAVDVGDAGAKVQGQALDGLEADGKHPEIGVVGVVGVGQQRVRRIIGGAGRGIVNERKAHAGRRGVVEADQGVLHDVVVVVCQIDSDPFVGRERGGESVVAVVSLVIDGGVAVRLLENIDRAAKHCPRARSVSGLKAVLGFHLRYVDDIRIFCQSHREAQRALLALTELLRVRGLNVQSAKTYIVEAEKALLEIDGVGPVISQIHGDLLEEIREEAVGSYGTVADLERLAEENPENPPVEVLERAFDQYFLQPESEFDKSLFHFLLTRLGAVQSRLAVGFCMGALPLRPEETEYVLKYFEKIGLQPEEHDALADFLGSESALYHYQNYLVLKFYFESAFLPLRVLTICRAYVRDLTKPHWLRAYAAAIIGQVRDAADMEFLEANYAQCRDDVERATCICSATGLETRRRNEFLGRARRDGDLEDRARRFVRADRRVAKEPQPFVVVQP